MHWILFGSSGHRERPDGGVLRSYVRCLPLRHSQHTLVKSIVRLPCTAAAWSPHAFRHSCPDLPLVRTDHSVQEGPRADEPVHNDLVIHHYATKSQREFELKMRRGSGMKRQRGWEYFYCVDGWSVEWNMDALAVWDERQPSPAERRMERASVAAALARYANETHQDHWLRGR